MPSDATTRTMLGKTVSIDNQKYYAAQICAIYLRQSGSYEEFTYDSLYNFIFNEAKFIQLSKAYIQNILFNGYNYENSFDNNQNFTSNVNIRDQLYQKIEPNTRTEIIIVCTSATTAVNVGYYLKYYHQNITYLKNKFIKIPRIQNLTDRYCIESFYLFVCMQLRDCIGNKVETQIDTEEFISYSIIFHYDGVGKGESQVVLNGELF